MTANPNVLTVSDALVLGRIAQASATGARVRRLVGHDVVEGTARSIGDLNGNHAGSDEDIRDAHLRVTTTSGFEAFWPVRDLMGDLRDTVFHIDE